MKREDAVTVAELHDELKDALISEYGMPLPALSWIMVAFALLGTAALALACAVLYTGLSQAWPEFFCASAALATLLLMIGALVLARDALTLLAVAAVELRLIRKRLDSPLPPDEVLFIPPAAGTDQNTPPPAPASPKLR